MAKKVTDGNSLSLKKKAMLEALRKSMGVVTGACEAAGIARKTYYEWLKADPVFKEAVDNMPDIALDFAESKLFSKINKGDTTAIIFYLKTKGKKRGYIEKHVVDSNVNLLDQTKIIDFVVINPEE